MTVLGDTEALAHFSQMKSVYSALLASLDPGEGEGSIGSTLKPLLSTEIYEAYLDLHPQWELAVVDLVEFLGGFFLLDSQGCYNSEAASRVVGAIGVSQAAPTLRELLARLAGLCHTGQPADDTLELIRRALWVAEDAASQRKRQDLYQAIYTALDIKKKGLMCIFEDIVAKSNYSSRLSYESARYLRSLSHLIHDSLGIEPSAIGRSLPKRGQFLPVDFWVHLRGLVDVADRSLPEDRRSSLVESLGRFYLPATNELMASLASPSSQLPELVERYVCPLVDDGQGRPRNLQAQRRLRVAKDTEHLYDIGHFLPHSAGGPKDINLFVQERSLNRGWSEQGKRYRWLERLVFSHPDTFFFVRPVYGDLSPIPRYLEWGALLDEALVGEIMADIDRMPDLHLIGPSKENGSGPKLWWLISVFENFKAEAIIDLMRSARG